jgi:hypothetical protein
VFHCFPVPAQDGNGANGGKGGKGGKGGIVLIDTMYDRIGHWIQQIEFNNYKQHQKTYSY